MSLLKLNRRGGLAGYVVEDAVHAGDFGDDAAAHAVQQVVGQLRPVGGHGVGALHGAHDDGVPVGALVAHDAHGADVRQRGEVLPHGVLAVALAGLLEQALVVGVQLLAHDGVGVLQDLQLLGVHVADDADGQTRAREGLAVHDAVGQPERRAQRPHLVLEEVVQRLDEVEVHALGERNEVVVTLDGARLAAGLAGAALDDVGVDGALNQVATCSVMAICIQKC